MVSLVFARLSVVHLAAIIAAALLTSRYFRWPGFINAVFARNFDQVNWIPTFVLTPLTYFGGVFYSVRCCRAGRRGSRWPIRSCTWSMPFAMAFLGASDVHVAAAFVLMLVLTRGLFAVCGYAAQSGRGYSRVRR
jgi:ABC-2 type transport system permease protein